jgi:hypothetical protein
MLHLVSLHMQAYVVADVHIAVVKDCNCICTSEIYVSNP